jgi:hypothetical protein
MRGAASLRLDASAVVASFGGADALSAALEEHKILAITPYAVNQWCRRRQIPYARRFELELLAKQQDREFDLSKFYLPADAPEPAPRPKRKPKPKVRAKVKLKPRRKPSKARA